MLGGVGLGGRGVDIWAGCGVGVVPLVGAIAVTDWSLDDDARVG